MAKLSKIAKEKVRLLKSTRCSARRAQLRAEQSDLSKTFEERLAAQEKLQKLSRLTSKSRVTRRCSHPTCGRPRGVYRKFGLCKMHIREAMNRGDLPGAKKACWG